MKDTFVSIACYRDFDVVNTVNNMIQMAREPWRLRIVVVVQDDHWNFHVYKQISHLAELYFFTPDWCEGAGKARHEVLRHYYGEKYFYQSDSHMRFEKNWDAMLHHELRACGVEKPILTTFPPNFTPSTGQLDAPCFNHIMMKNFYRNIPITVAVSVPMSLYVPTIRPLRTAFLAAGVLFTYGKFVQEVPCDPYFYFQGEEISMTVRAWTHGWSVFSPRFCFCYHAYRNDLNPKVKALSETDPQKDMFLFNRSIQRAQVIIGAKQPHEVEPHVLEYINMYGNGSVRPLESWGQTFGINVVTETAERRAYAEGYDEVKP